MPTDHLAAIVVHHRSLATLPATLRALIHAGVPAHRVVVVDNSEGHVTDAELRDAVPPGSILRRADNRGYAAAVNHGLGVVREISPPPAQVLVATHEALLDPTSLTAMCAALDADSRLGAVGPVLETSDGRPWSAGGFLTRILRLPRHLSPADHKPGPGVRTVAWLDGALVLYRAEAIEGRSLDERYFLYMEEVDFHLSLASSGWLVGICDNARASQDSSGMPAFYAARNIQLLQRKWGRPGLRWMASLSVMSRGLARSVLSRDRTRGVDLIRGYLDGRRALR